VGVRADVAAGALAALAHAVDRDLANPDHAPATERVYAHDCSASRISASGTTSRLCRATPWVRRIPDHTVKRDLPAPAIAQLGDDGHSGDRANASHGL
jgi:hypothetical protein